MSEAEGTPMAAKVNKIKHVLWQKKQAIVDNLAPYQKERWIGLAVLVLVFTYSIVSRHKFYLIAYAWAIFFLNQFMMFLSPAVQPDSDGLLPTSMVVDDEFRPFVRALPEKKFWENVFLMTAGALFLTLFPFMDIPVFWPILVMYFVVLFFVTMKDQVVHMIKHKYLPWTHGKKRYDQQPLSRDD